MTVFNDPNPEQTGLSLKTNVSRTRESEWDVQRAKALRDLRKERKKLQDYRWSRKERPERRHFWKGLVSCFCLNPEPETEKEEQVNASLPHVRIKRKNDEQGRLLHYRYMFTLLFDCIYAFTFDRQCTRVYFNERVIHKHDCRRLNDCPFDNLVNTHYKGTQSFYLIISHSLIHLLIKSRETKEQNGNGRHAGTSRGWVDCGPNTLQETGTIGKLDGQLIGRKTSLLTFTSYPSYIPKNWIQNSKRLYIV